MPENTAQPTRDPALQPRGPRPLPPPPEGPSPQVRLFLWVFSVVLVLVAGSAFIFKLMEFYATATTSGPSALASFLIPVLNYLLVAAGFFCLFLWAYLAGQFRDMEAAKYRMLELQAQIDFQEREARP